MGVTYSRGRAIPEGSHISSQSAQKVGNISARRRPRYYTDWAISAPEWEVWNLEIFMMVKPKITAFQGVGDVSFGK